MKSKFVKLIQASIKNISREEERKEIIDWFLNAKRIIDEDSSLKIRGLKLYKSVNSKDFARVFLAGLGETLRNYIGSTLPFPLKVSIPLTTLAILLLGPKGAGLAAFGGAVGVPVVVLLFIGSTGIAAIVDPFISGAKDSSARDSITSTISLLGLLVAQNKISKSLEKQLKKDISRPRKKNLSNDEKRMMLELQQMNPFEFEKHVMSLFEDAGLEAVVTEATNDFGLDGWAVHDKGLIIVQCKRFSGRNKVGRPAIQQFKGVLEEQREKGSQIYKAVIVTSNTFTNEAIESARLNKDLTLVDIKALISWHQNGLKI